MKVVLLNGATFEVNVIPVDLWIVYKLVREGKLEAVLCGNGGEAIGNLRRIDPERTFGDLIAESCRDTLPPGGEMAVAGADAE